MLGFFEEEIGIPYPWAKYYQVCVQDFVVGGMENTSCTTLTDYTLFTDATENIRTSEGLIAHELAHQWFGDFVTCKDWSHIWLNESFATYYQSLYNAHKNGRDSMLLELYGRARQITGITNNFNPIVRRTYESRTGDVRLPCLPEGELGAAHVALAIGRRTLSAMHKDLSRAPPAGQRRDAKTCGGLLRNDQAATSTSSSISGCIMDIIPSWS